MKFFLSLSLCTYKFNDEKSGRTHFGFISQDVEQALGENDMSAYDFAGFCKDILLRRLNIDVFTCLNFYLHRCLQSL